MKIPKKWGGGVGSGVGCQGRCTRRSDVFVKIQKQNLGGGGGGFRLRRGSGVRLGGGQGGFERRIDVFVKIQKKKKKKKNIFFFWRGGGGGWVLGESGGGVGWGWGSG